MLCGLTCSVMFATSDIPTYVRLTLLIISFDSLGSEFCIVTVDGFFGKAYTLHVWQDIEWIRVPFDFPGSWTCTTVILPVTKYQISTYVWCGMSQNLALAKSTNFPPVHVTILTLRLDKARLQLSVMWVTWPNKVNCPVVSDFEYTAGL